jgi:hypothetical protein
MEIARLTAICRKTDCEPLTAPVVARDVHGIYAP